MPRPPLNLTPRNFTPFNLYPLNVPSQRTLSTYPLNASSQCTPSTYPLNAPPQRTLSPALKDEWVADKTLFRAAQNRLTHVARRVVTPLSLALAHILPLALALRS